MERKLAFPFLTLLVILIGLCSSCRRSDMQRDELGSSLVALNVSQDDFLYEGDSLFVASRAVDLAFETADKIGLYIHTEPEVHSSNNHTSNLAYELASDGKWSAMGSLGAVLTDGESYNVTAYYPYAMVVADPLALAHSVLSDQSTHANVSLSDFMLSSVKAIENPTSMPAVDLKFAHKMSKLCVVACVPTKMGGVQVKSVKSVSFKGLKPTTTISLATGTLSAASGYAVEITPNMSQGDGLAGSTCKWEAIVVPQTLSTGSAPGIDLVVFQIEMANGSIEELKYTIEPGVALALQRNIYVSIPVLSNGSILISKI